MKSFLILKIFKDFCNIFLEDFIVGFLRIFSAKKCLSVDDYVCEFMRDCQYTHFYRGSIGGLIGEWYGRNNEYFRHGGALRKLGVLKSGGGGA